MYNWPLAEQIDISKQSMINLGYYKDRNVNTALQMIGGVIGIKAGSDTSSRLAE